MKILVCVTHVPDTTSRIRFTNNDTRFDSESVQFIIGPYDDYALARAVELKNNSYVRITALNVGPAETEPTLRKALAIGADEAIRIDAEPTDSFFIAEQIAENAKSYDLILMGRESIDYNSGVVHSMTGELLGWPSVSPVMKLDIISGIAKMEKEIDGGKEYIEAPLPLVLGCQEPIAEWKIPNMRGIMSARTKPLNVIPAKPVNSTVQLKKYLMPPPKGQVKMIEPDNIKELVDALKKEAKVL